MKYAESNKDAPQHEDRGRRCKYCNGKHPPRKCPAYGKKCAKCNCLNHFAEVRKSKMVNSVGQSQVHAVKSQGTVIRVRRRNDSYLIKGIL